MGYVIVLSSVFSLDGLCNCERHLVELMKLCFWKFLCFVSPYFYYAWLTDDQSWTNFLGQGLWRLMNSRMD